MEADSGLNLLVAGGDAKRMQWLNYHVTSHWPDARVTTITGGDLGCARAARQAASRMP